MRVIPYLFSLLAFFAFATPAFAASCSPSSPYRTCSNTGGACCYNGQAGVCDANGICQISSNTSSGGSFSNSSYNTNNNPLNIPSSPSSGGGNTSGNVTASPGFNTSQTVSPGYNTGTGNGATLINPLKGATLTSFLSDILNFVIQIGVIVIILMLVFVGYKFVAARGAPTQIEEAKKMLLWTLIGALVLLGAQAISLAIQTTVHNITNTAAPSYTGIGA